MKGEAKKRIGERGVSWQIVVELPRDTVTGKRRQKFLTAPTKREVEALATQLLATLENGGIAESDAKKMTVKQFLERWLDSIGSSVRDSTQARYRQLTTQHISTVIGHIHLTKLTPLDVQKLYADRLKAKLSTTTVALLHNILHKALKQGMRWGLLTRNVTEAVDPPREATPEYITWNQEQTAAFLAVSDKDVWAAFWRLALLTGMRRGELMGLKWDDIDFQRRNLSVKRTLSRGAKGGFTFGLPKTAHGRRSIALPQSAVESLQRHRVKQLEARLKVASTYKDDDLVFANALGEPLHPNTIAYRFKKLQKDAGLPVIRIHDLRHTSATLMLANGEHPKIVQERLGHADVSMTLNRYSHVTMDMQREAADRLDRLIDGAS